ncbi:MAG TPA: hypothetical protein VMU80_00940 [Bryobacteraceae bacterium]|nr:hypothetical protein [Bryobacteraceae bacterium]
MSIEVGHVINWRWQGVKSCCWLTAIEMLMGFKYNNIYGRNQTKHSDGAMEDYRKNKGAFITWHAEHYGLAENRALEDGDLGVWKRALDLGPVLAEGNYGWSRFGAGKHVILIAGISKSGNVAFYNPNVFAVLPHPMSKISYMSLGKCKELSSGINGGPFWQTTDDVRDFKLGLTSATRAAAV